MKKPCWMWKAEKLNIMQMLIAVSAAISIFPISGCTIESQHIGSIASPTTNTRTGKSMSSPTPTSNTQKRNVSRPWTAIHNWAYWLDNPDLKQLGATPFELVVVDYSADGSAQKAFTKQQIDELRLSACQRRVVSYLSIGQAESYRWYWQQRWKPGAPAWLDSSDPDWEGNYWVRYWDPAWQQIIYRYLDAIIAAGFDGVYLDRIDTYEERYAAGHEDDMVRFVTDIAHYGRTHSPLGNDFGIIVQNAEDLAASHSQYVQTVTGIGREEVYVQATNKPTSASERTTIERLLDLFRQNSQGKLVLTIDYAHRADLIRTTHERSRAKGYVPYVASVNLDRLQINAGYEPTCSPF